MMSFSHQSELDIFVFYQDRLDVDYYPQTQGQGRVREDK